MSIKRFGPRYGRRTKYQFAQVEKQHRGRHKCPFCNKIAVKRVAAGIWSCQKCGKKFSGKAYTL